MLLILTDAPEDSIERIMWLSGALDAAKREIETAFAEAYFTARLEGRFDSAVSAGPYARSSALRLTRQWNNRTGRMVRWGDGLDASSTAYRGS
jgi:hypothetical protein